MSDPNNSISSVPGLVSVIMPAYNAERFIAEAIESVLAQTYPHWELIVVDDGSTDGTPSVLQRFTDPRIRVIRQENKGEGGARNTGLDVAQGEYIGFLDADDLYLPNALTDFVRFFSDHSEFGVVFSDGYMCNAELRPLMRISEHRAGHYTGDVLEPLVLHSTVVSQPVCMMVRSASLQAYGIRFDEELRYGVDWDFWTQLARFVKFGDLGKLTGLYRVHQTNMTRMATERKRKDDLLVGRLKIMRSAWFNDLSNKTRVGLFYYTLIDLLEGQPERQSEIIDSPQFLSLPTKERCYLLRRIASEYMQRHQEERFARHCLLQALEAWPSDRKARLLLHLADLGQTTSQLTLSAWSHIKKLQTQIASIGKEVPGRAPDGFRPSQD